MKHRLLLFFVVLFAACTGTKTASTLPKDGAALQKLFQGTWTMTGIVVSGERSQPASADGQLTVTRTTMIFSDAKKEETTKYQLNGNRIIDPDKPNDTDNVLTIKTLTNTALVLQLETKTGNPMELRFKRD